MASILRCIFSLNNNEHKNRADKNNKEQKDLFENLHINTKNNFKKTTKIQPKFQPKMDEERIRKLLNVNHYMQSTCLETSESENNEYPNHLEKSRLIESKMYTNNINIFEESKDEDNSDEDISKKYNFINRRQRQEGALGNLDAIKERPSENLKSENL